MIISVPFYFSSYVVNRKRCQSFNSFVGFLSYHKSLSGSKYFGLTKEIMHRGRPVSSFTVLQIEKHSNFCVNGYGKRNLLPPPRKIGHERRVRTPQLVEDILSRLEYQLRCTVGSKIIRKFAIALAIFLFDCQFLSSHACYKQYKA